MEKINIFAYGGKERKMSVEEEGKGRKERLGFPLMYNRLTLAGTLEILSLHLSLPVSHCLCSSISLIYPLLSPSPFLSILLFLYSFNLSSFSLSLYFFTLQFSLSLSPYRIPPPLSIPLSLSLSVSVYILYEILYLVTNKMFFLPPPLENSSQLQWNNTS